MKKLNIAGQIVKNFNKVNSSLVGKHVLVKHQKYPQIQDIIKKVYKMPGINIKQVSFEDAQPILVREGDRFNIEVLT